MAPTLAVCRDRASSTLAPKGGGTTRGPPSSAGLDTGPQPVSPGAPGHLGVRVCVCVCVPAKHFRVPQTRHPRWGLHLEWCWTRASLGPLASLRRPERSLQLAPVNVVDHNVSVLWFVLSSSPRGAECRRIYPAASSGSALGQQVITCAIYFGFSFLFFGNYKC